MKVQKIFLTLLALSLLISSCRNNNENTDNNTNNGNNTNMTENDNGNNANSNENMNDNNTNDNIDNNDNNNATVDDNAGVNDDTGANPVDKVESADDAVKFIDANVYSRCGDVLPMMVETRILPGDDMDSITYNTGLTDTSGIDDIILSESMVGSFAYSLVYLRTDGTNIADLQTALGNSINPAKWVCVSAESISSITLDDDILLVMGDKDQVDTIMDSVLAAAENVYDNIGSVVTIV